MLKCHDVTELVSKGLDTKLGGWARLQVSLHVFICKNCQRYQKQLNVLQGTFYRIEKVSEHIVLSSDAKQRISKILEKEINK